MERRATRGLTATRLGPRARQEDDKRSCLFLLPGRNRKRRDRRAPSSCFGLRTSLAFRKARAVRYVSALLSYLFFFLFYYNTQQTIVFRKKKKISRKCWQREREREIDNRTWGFFLHSLPFGFFFCTLTVLFLFFSAGVSLS